VGTTSSRLQRHVVVVAQTKRKKTVGLDWVQAFLCLKFEDEDLATISISKGRRTEKEEMGVFMTRPPLENEEKQ
jgi:hypothetical protein